MLTSNTDYGSFVSLIENENPDIIVVMEINENWVDALDLLKKDYRYSKLAPRTDNFGIGVYSKLPITMESVAYFGPAGIPSIVLSLETAKGALTLVATHPLPPVSNDYLRSRNKQLLHVAQEIKKIDGPLILAGDLNTTMWSSHYDQLEKNGGLRNVRRGFGIHATWPSQLGFLGIPIDHVLISEEIKVVDMKVGASVGSDHLPLIIELSIIENVSPST
ncbi:MAG: endonuclease/exonuclease/phosphatase family protein [Akkermansiaceae bacterium]